MADQAPLEAHHAYVTRGRLTAGSLRAPVFRAWERSHLAGADPLRLAADRLNQNDTETLLTRQSVLLECARPYMVALSRAAGGERHAAMLGDAEGYVLDVVGDEESVNGPGAVPGPGALLCEATAGANGIGSPLAEKSYVELIGPEHFIEGFHSFTCQGIPIHDPDSGVLGSISTSVRRPAAGRRIHEILVCAAHGIETELLRRRLEDDVRRVLESGGLDKDLTEQLRQDIVQSQAAARLKVEVAARDLSANQLNEAMRLLGLAERSIESFRRQSALWHDLASVAITAPRRVGLDRMVRDLAALLATEASTNSIEVCFGDVEPITIEADAQKIARRLLRAFLSVFDVARGGGAVRVDVLRLGATLAEVRLTPMPPFGRAGELAARSLDGGELRALTPIRLTLWSTSTPPWIRGGRS